MGDPLRWTSSTCSLEVEEGCRERERVGHAFVDAVVSLCRSNLFNTTCISGFALGKNVVHQLSVSLEEMYKGSTRRLGLQKNVICEKCEGRLFSFLSNCPVSHSLNNNFLHRLQVMVARKVPWRSAQAAKVKEFKYGCSRLDQA